MIFVVIGLVALLGIMALSIDLGLAYTARTQAQAAADATALAAAATMIDADARLVTLAQSQSTAISTAAANRAYPSSSLLVTGDDLTYGDWDLDTRTFDTGVDLTDVDQVTAVRAAVRLDGTANPSVPAVFGKLLGRSSFNVGAEAIAYLGFAGSIAPGEVDLPVAIPCCILSGASCSDSYCASGAPVPNACSLQSPQPRGDNTVSCLQFQNTADQTACWTEFDASSRNINTADLVDIVRNSNGEGISVDESVYVDNGDKTPVISTIHDRFYATGSFSGSTNGGQDTDGDGINDSWVVRLPVVSCQDEARCATGDPADVRGFVCFEIREVTVTPDKIIRGTFLCPELHPTQYQQCIAGLGPTGSGGDDYGIRADIPVLVQ